MEGAMVDRSSFVLRAAAVSKPAGQATSPDQCGSGPALWRGGVVATDHAEELDGELMVARAIWMKRICQQFLQRGPRRFGFLPVRPAINKDHVQIMSNPGNDVVVSWPVGMLEGDGVIHAGHDLDHIGLEMQHAPVDVGQQAGAAFTKDAGIDEQVAPPHQRPTDARRNQVGVDALGACEPFVPWVMVSPVMTPI
jgi:hypothetical protein